MFNLLFFYRKVLGFKHLKLKYYDFYFMTHKKHDVIHVTWNKAVWSTLKWKMT